MLDIIAQQIHTNHVFNYDKDKQLKALLNPFLLDLSEDPKHWSLSFCSLIGILFSKFGRVTVLHLEWEPALYVQVLLSTAFFNFSQDFFSDLDFLFEANAFFFHYTSLLAFENPLSWIWFLHIAYELWKRHVFTLRFGQASEPVIFETFSQLAVLQYP